MKWYYAENNERRGPIEDAALATLVAAGTVTPDSLVWHEGMAAWQPYREVAHQAATARPVLATAVAELVGTAQPGQPGAEQCSQCGQYFLTDDMIRYEGRHVCAACKPLFFQRVKEGASVAGQREYAGFWIRFAAKFVDGLMLQIGGFVLNVGLSLVGLTGNTLMWTGMGVGLLLNAAYSIYFTGRGGATPGKMACKLRVIRADDSPMTYGRATGRYFAEIVSALSLFIGYLMAGFDEEKRALHDRICDTRVIRVR